MMKENNKGSDSGHDFIRTSLVLGCFFLLLFYVRPASAANQNSGLSPEEEVIGEPWEGETGTGETVGEIMKRQEAMRYISAPPVPRVIPFRRMPNREFAPQNPDSPSVSGTPAPGGVGPLISVRPFTPQVVGPPNFLGATYADTNVFPPDSMGAVGPTQYIVALNNRIRSFNKTTGLADGVLNVNPDVFFSSVRNGSQTSDPRIRYDRLSGRWFIVMINVSTPNRILIAVSDNASAGIISNSTVWTLFFIPIDSTHPVISSSCLADYPTLGIDANALYIGTNNFCPSFDSSDGYVVRKSSVLGGGPLVVTVFRGLVPNASLDGPFTPQGVDNYDPLATQGYFIGVSALHFGELVLRRVSNPATTPSLSGNVLITVPTTSYPLSVPHQGNNGGLIGNLDALDDRLFAAHLRNGSLWTAHNIAVDNTGAGTLTGDRDGSRWYEITNLTGTPILVQSGTVFDSTTPDPRFYWIPSIMVSGQGHAALGFSTAGTLYHADAATVGRLANDALGTTGIPELYTNSITAYNPSGDPGTSTLQPRRWGDYSYTSLDPGDDMTMWTIQEFCNATNSYGVQVVKLFAPPPATPASASPSIVPAGRSSVDIVVTGTSVAGSGFFDPGVGFNHIGAVIGGVIVNSITYTNPTHVTVNISTVGSTPGSFAVTVTNPDGQSRTSTSSILNVCSPLTISPPSIPGGDKGSLYARIFTPAGGTGPYTIKLIGTLPSGVLFSSDTSTGTISGTPTVTGGFPFTVSAVDRNGCSGSANYTLRVTEPNGTITNVRINGTVPAYYDTVQGALAAVVNGDSIQMRAVNFIETLSFNVPAAVTLSGGYSTDYSSHLSYTTVTGSLTISAGTVTIENVILH